jgi:hypothetical protein
MIDWMEKARRRLRIEAMIGGSTPMSAFDQFLADTREELASTRLGQPLIDVADTMVACKKWFESHDVAFTASDLVAMARLVLERERATRQEETSLIVTNATRGS